MIRISFLVLACLLVLTKSTLPPADQLERIRAFTRQIEFDYVTWTVDALLRKAQFLAISPQKYLEAADQQKIISDYYQQVREINTLQDKINQIYGDPNIINPTESASGLASQLDSLEKENRTLGVLCEAILQQQVSQTAAELKLGFGGQLIPPLLYHVTALPQALIVSPRSIIQQDADISILPELSLEEIIALENQVEWKLDVSALVVPIGGVGIYPTMVMRETDLAWMIEVIAHEWVHNFLTLRPLGILYYENPQLRSMNETTASLAGKEIALAVYTRYYPQLVPIETPQQGGEAPAGTAEQPMFDYRQEMRETRITVDGLLADGKIEQAEEYMEARRVFFWQNGYRIRRLNQAYFAFYGAYADVPGGPAGVDPVGPAVRELRAGSASLAHFLNRISWMTSFEALQKSLRKSPG